MNPRLLLISTLCAVFFLAPSQGTAALSWLEQVHPDVFAKMREVERYQIKVAEKHYLAGEFKIALAEYEKYLTLYEKSGAAPYAQLMWGHCQLQLRHANTAIRDGFQSVIDYWPDSYDAIRAGYLIADTYRQMGEVENAERAYRKVINDHEKHFLATLCRTNLLDLAKIAKDEKKTLEILRELTFDTARDEQTSPHTIAASRELAALLVSSGDLPKALEALGTSYAGDTLTFELYSLTSGFVANWANDPKSRTKATELGDFLIAALEKAIPTVLDTPESRAQASGAFLKIASLHNSLRRGEAVLDTYQKMIKILGKSDDILGHIATWYKANDRRENAYATYRDFADKDAGLIQIATMLVEDERHEQAFATYRQLSDKDAGLTLAGDLQLKLGMGEEAIATYMEISDEVVALGLVATAYRTLGKWDDAIKTYQDLIQKNTEGINDYMWAIGECYESSARLHEAIRTYRQVDRFPANYFKAASLHRQLKEFDEAVTLYQQCKVDAGAAPEASIQIGYTYEQAGDKEKAINSFRLVCKSFPKSGHASQAHAHLQTTYNISVTLGGATDE